MRKSLDFLRVELASGKPREAGELQRLAKQKGISPRSLSDAKTLLGIEVSSVWRMPPPSD
jgi:hypothetical protein